MNILSLYRYQISDVVDKQSHGKGAKNKVYSLPSAQSESYPDAAQPRKKCILTGSREKGFRSTQIPGGQGRRQTSYAVRQVKGEPSSILGFRKLCRLTRQQPVEGAAKPTATSLAAVAAMQQPSDEAGPSSGITFHNPIDSALTRDSSSKAFMRELRKVIERSDVIIQVLDARDPEGTRSRWVEEEVRKRDIEGKKLLAVMNKIGEH